MCRPVDQQPGTISNQLRSNRYAAHSGIGALSIYQGSDLQMFLFNVLIDIEI